MIEYAVKNPLITNFLLLSVVVVGILSWQAMPQEMFPIIESDSISIDTEYEGAPPIEVERQLTIPIEDEVDDISEIDELQSVSLEGNSRISLDLKPNVNIEEAMRSVEIAVDSIEDLPDDIEKPRITRRKTNFPVISVSVYGDVSETELIRGGEIVKQALQKVDGVGRVSMAGDRETEVWVVVNPYEIAAKEVSLEEIRNALSANLGDRPGGSLSALEGDIQLRGMSVADNVQAIEDIAIRTNSDGGQLRVGDIADVEMTLETVQTQGRFSGLRSLNLVVTKDAKASTNDIAAEVRRLVADEIPLLLPAAINVGYHNDLSVYIDTRLNTVFSSGLIGLVLLLTSLYLLLNFRVALITAFGIPVSFLVAVISIYYLGFTINMVSLFAFLIALGMIVDDAIIVTENIHHYIEEGMPVRQAALRGTREIVAPVVAATLTTVVAFLPLLAIGGRMGEFVKVIPVVVSAALIGSLLEAFFVLPAHANLFLKARNGLKAKATLIARSVGAAAVRPTAMLSGDKKQGFVDWTKLLAPYKRYLRWGLHNRYFIFVAASCALLLALIILTTRVPFQLFGHVDVDEFFVNIEAPSNYSIEETEALAMSAEKEVYAVFDGHEHELDTLLTNVGVLMSGRSGSRPSKTGDNYFQFSVSLSKQKPQTFVERFVVPLVNFKFEAEGTRTRSVEEIIQLIRERVPEMPGVKRFSILRSQAGPGGADIEISIAGSDLEQLEDRAEEMIDFMQGIAGVYDLQHDMDRGKLEVRYQLNERGQRLGITQKQIADALRTGYLGIKAVYVNWGNERYPVRVIFDEDIRSDSNRLMQLPLTLADGKVVYLNEVATLKLDRSFNRLNRLDGRRIVTITGEVDSEKITAFQVYGQVARKFAPLYAQAPEYDMVFRGEKKRADDSFRGTKVAGIIAIMGIFLILLVLFRTLTEPVLILLTVPFGFVGVVIGHALFGYNLQFVSIVGLVALSGIIVNDSLIMLDQIRRYRKQGYDCEDAVVAASYRRARPIILTTITTFLGVSPLIFFATGQTKFLSPMAISLGFGLIFATVLILTVLPCLYMIAEDLKGYIRKRI